MNCKLVSCLDCYDKDCEDCDEANQEYIDTVMGD